jgi:light-regulated signal transduction histidine kinase (bacteriophytochrome)
VNEPAGIGGRYAAALQSYFETGDETALSVAYQLGRRAISEGLGILDMVSVHQKIVKDGVLPAPAAELAYRVERAGDFLREILSPFEMTFRGYREANDELQRLNEKLARQRDDVEIINQELESFSYSVSHDLRAPLRSIDGFSQALLEDCADVLDENGRRHLGHVRAAAQDMARLIDDLLRLARVARADMTRTDVDMSALARQIVARLQVGAPGRRVEFVAHDRVHGMGDAPLLAVLLENLLGNAWKFTSKRAGAHIEFGLTEPDGRLVYFVRDDGAGFDMAYASKLFGTFQRLHAARDFEGTGIGLATVQRIARRHGGQVWAEGEVDRGAIFYFTLGASGARS